MRFEKGLLGDQWEQYGYMAANYGIFSFKSDVFSFGVLVLEILSDKKNIETIERDNIGTDLIG
ncbi:unnamed protein product [Musa acuminata subsp. malaccensis]|uniref:(wild Malaysian banana) hypothetical protein n=1 Tax=Musa acuminata subsp. malaccensis TaxID=214687 RepID=A0A804L6K7_MUSAM|nr:unnamed protein product [Musa acuminata subsp. malaccensis]